CCYAIRNVLRRNAGMLIGRRSSNVSLARTLTRTTGILPVEFGDKLEACLPSQAGRLAPNPPREAGFQLGQSHRPEQTVINNPIRRQTVGAFICPNGILSSRTDYAVDRPAVISGAGESLLDANYDGIVVSIGVSVIGVRVTGPVIVVVIT